LSLHLNEYKLSASRTAAGRLFHTTGPATEKALSPSQASVQVITQDRQTDRVQCQMWSRRDEGQRNNWPSRDMPTARQRTYRQYRQALRVRGLITQFISPLHV